MFEAYKINFLSIKNRVISLIEVAPIGNYWHWGIK